MEDAEGQMEPKARSETHTSRPTGGMVKPDGLPESPTSVLAESSFLLLIRLETPRENLSLRGLVTFAVFRL